MKAKDIMTPNPRCASASDSLEDVARIMRDQDCGSVPVVAAGCLVGIITDRDIAIRVFAEGRAADVEVEEVMTRAPACCRADADIREVERLMADEQVRRVPIVDADGCCIGIVAQADLARAAAHGSHVSEREVARVVEQISEPRRADSIRGVGGELEQMF